MKKTNFQRRTGRFARISPFDQTRLILLAIFLILILINEVNA